MSLSKISARYAKSLLDLAIEKGQLDAVHQDMALVSETCGNKDMHMMLKSPVITADRKVKVIQSLFGQKAGELTLTFLEILVHKGRESMIPAICSAFADQYKTLKKIRPARLICASPLSEAEIAQVKSKFQSWLQPGETMELTQVTNPAIIGGYVFEMEGRQVDATVKRSLDQMRSGLFDTSYTNLVVKS